MFGAQIWESRHLTGSLSRCLNGMLNGNIGVIKSMLAELTDDSNMARGFSLIPVIWALGGTIGFGDIYFPSCVSG
jgi:hypothetical protein